MRVNVFPLGAIIYQQPPAAQRNSNTLLGNQERSVVYVVDRLKETDEKVKKVRAANKTPLAAHHEDKKKKKYLLQCLMQLTIKSFIRENARIKYEQIFFFFYYPIDFKTSIFFLSRPNVLPHTSSTVFAVLWRFYAVVIEKEKKGADLFSDAENRFCIFQEERGSYCI